MGNITGAGLRKAVLKAINPKTEGLTDWMRAHAAGLVDGILSHGAPVDLRGQFTNPYAENLHCRILGIPEADAPRLAASLDIAFMNSACPSRAPSSTGTGTWPTWWSVSTTRPPRA
ncbi:hypothetical protein WKI68_00755 [Streptomyces sp. MS1.HAVA.3]|uniref:Uncharacterized protein n=1 Tax=Streptomyces caledonius TaxID=3134107 RepID=A0ABU8TXL3_9ACTN